MRESHPASVSRRAVLLGGAFGGLAALAGCGGRPDPGVGRLVLATGPPGAVFREIGTALVEVLRRRMPDTEVTARETAASRENLRLLRDGRARVGFSSLDAALGDDGEPPEGLTALGRVYDSFLHLAVPEDSPISDHDDLAGRPVSFGADHSGTEFTVERLTRLTGQEADDRRLDQASSAEALRSGEIAAMFSLTGTPTPAIAGLARDDGVRLVDLGRQANRLADAFPGSYFPATIPATAYAGVPATPTVAVPNLLLARADLPDAAARAVTETVFTQASTIAADRPEAAHINVRTGIATGPVPLHPGAEQWFREQKP